MQQQGYVHLYTGNGKGKTTAAFGLALRATGAGLKSIFIQFMKGQHYSELDAVKQLNGKIIIEQYGSPEFCFVDDKNIGKHRSLAADAIERARGVLAAGTGNFDIVVLDEVITALLFKIVTFDDIIGLISIKPKNIELVLTGRGAPEELFPHCDLITEMREIKHYYQKNVQARKGIEN